MELKKREITQRKLENKMLKSRLQQDKDVYREVCNNYSMLLKNAKQRQISLKYVVVTQENCFKLYDPCLISLTKISSLPADDDRCKLAVDFGEFLCWKGDLIRNDTDTVTVVPPVLNVPAPENKFEKFDVLCE